MVNRINPAILSSQTMVVKVTMTDLVYLHLLRFQNGHWKHGLCVTQMTSGKKNALRILESSVSYIYVKENSDDNIERLVIGWS